MSCSGASHEEIKKQALYVCIHKNLALFCGVILTDGSQTVVYANVNCLALQTKNRNCFRINKWSAQNWQFLLLSFQLLRRNHQNQECFWQFMNQAINNCIEDEFVHYNPTGSFTHFWPRHKAKNNLHTMDGSKEWEKIWRRLQIMKWTARVL